MTSEFSHRFQNSALALSVHHFNICVTNFIIETVLWVIPFRSVAVLYSNLFRARISRFSISALSLTAEESCIIVTKEAIFRPVFNFPQILPGRQFNFVFT